MKIYQANLQSDFSQRVYRLNDLWRLFRKKWKAGIELQHEIVIDRFVALVNLPKEQLLAR